MNVLFVTLEIITDIKSRSLYSDVIREIEKNGHFVTVVSAREKRNQRNITIENHFYSDNKKIEYLLVDTDNITKNKNFFSKGLAVVTVGYKYKKALRKLKDDIRYDLVICTTPCITFETIVSYVKKKDNPKIVLLLKDMWPYDLLFDNVLKKTGIKGIIYKYFDHIARKLLDCADVIGCMSPKNIEFLINATENNGLLAKTIVIPNSIDPLSLEIQDDSIEVIRKRYDIPKNKVVYVYGGNLGLAQGVDFVIEAIKKATKNQEAFFVIAGSGTEAGKVKAAFRDNPNVKYLGFLQRDEYEKLVYSCDVGLVFLTWNCHTPNFPSRILPLMQAGLPVICCTDDTTDIGEIAYKNNFGLSCPSNDVEAFVKSVNLLLDSKLRKKMGRLSRMYLEGEYSTAKTYKLIFENDYVEKESNKA